MAGKCQRGGAGRKHGPRTRNGRLESRPRAAYFEVPEPEVLPAPLLPAPLLPAVPAPEDVLSPVPLPVLEPLVPDEPLGGVAVAPGAAELPCPAPPLVMPLVPGAVAADEPLEAAPPGLDVLPLLVPVLVSAPVAPVAPLLPAAGAPVAPVPELLVVPAPEDVEPPLSPDLLQPPAASANTAMTGKARASLVSCIMVFPFSIGFACRRPGKAA